MKSILKILIIFFLTLFIAHQNLSASCFVLVGIDTAVIKFDQNIADFAEPFLLKASTGQSIKFVARNGEFSIFIRNADKFFEGVGQTLKIHIDSNGTAESDTYTIKNNLPIDFEIKYEVYCISRDIWVTAPPRIIIGHVVN